MKVSIITYHDEDNYGATLQAYSTYRAVRELGYAPEIINLHMRHKTNILDKIVYCLKRYRFNDFRSIFMPTKTRIYTSVEDIRNDPPQSDVYLVGSDQTWNPTISKKYALAYFLDFGSENQKRISYASSFGTSSWCNTEFASRDNVKRLLSRFSTLLIREDIGVEIAKNEFNLEAEQVVDPVLLFPSYPELTGDLSETNDIVVYKIKNDTEFYRRAVLLGNSMNCRVRSIGSMRRPKGICASYPERIENWVKNIGTAKYVFTDSFHGTVLSLLYHRQFVVYVGNLKLISRITSLLKMVGLTNRICTNDNSIEEIVNLMNEKINYAKVDQILEDARTKSLTMLKNAIG